ncbi:MAG: copper transporter [Firmicutes bacterium]|nr:copper transporter [Bacillota bacterium]
MILDIRYHIASLVAVFLALGLGILIGASLLDEGRLLESQEKLIAGLEKRFDTLQAERSLLETENALLSSKLQEQETLFVALELPLVEEALEGRSVSVVYGSEAWKQNWQEPLDKLLKQAGARVVASRLITGLLHGSTTFSAQSGDMGKALTDSEGQDPMVNLQALVDDAQGLLGEKLRAESPMTIDVLLLVGTGGENTVVWEKLLAKEALVAGMAVAVVGTTDMEAHLSELAKGGALALDNLDSVAGRVGLIRGLLASQTGYYGVGKSAQGPWPPLSKAAVP